uniref:Leupeptin-inactivating enzyme 2 n=1 Tax=Aceria tosichella TaxID=561515 RepID=A0A6G1SKL5_9ACAR
MMMDFRPTAQSISDTLIYSVLLLVILISSPAAIAATPFSSESSATSLSLSSSNTNADVNSSSSSNLQYSATAVPRSERQPILEVFNKFFTKARSHDDQRQKEFVREGVVHRLRDMGFESSFLQKSRFEFRHSQDKHKRIPAVSYNIISIIPGKHRRTKNEKIILVGAHWDSAPKAPGVDDNGSGSTCLLEIARLVSEHQCKFQHTIMLVWFDYEEQGKYGSEFFVNDYLYPYELDKYQSKFIGAYIMDMILVRDKENNTQALPENLRKKLPDFFEEVEQEKSRGDFLATWSRKHWDEPLENTFRSAWQDLGYEARTFKAMRPELPQLRMPNDLERYEWKDFFRSDHASFWFPPLTSPPVRRAPNRTSAANHSSLNAILLTDLGPWRHSYLKCYHAPCDDEHLLTDGNLSFMQQVVDTLVLTLMRTGHGECGRSSIRSSPPEVEVVEKESRNSAPADTMVMAAAVTTTTTTMTTTMATTTTTNTSATTMMTTPVAANKTEAEVDVASAAIIAKISVPTTNTSLVL